MLIVSAKFCWLISGFHFEFALNCGVSSTCHFSSVMEKLFMMKEPFLVFLQNQHQNSFVYMKAGQGVGWKGEDGSVVFTSCIFMMRIISVMPSWRPCFYGAGSNSLPWSIPVWQKHGQEGEVLSQKIVKAYSIKAWLVKSNYDRGSELLEWLWNASAISLREVMSTRPSNLLQNIIRDLHFWSRSDVFSGFRIFFVDLLQQTEQSIGFYACYLVYLMSYESYSVGTMVPGHLT